MAVSVTVEAARIYLSGTGDITLDAVNTAVGDTAVMERTGSDPYVYEIKGNRELEWRSEVEFNCTNPNDELRWDLSANKSPVIDMQSGATWNVGPGFIIDNDTSGGNYGRWYIYGTMNFIGTEANPIVLKNYYDIRIYNREGNDPHTWIHVNMQSPTYSNSAPSLAFYNEQNAKLAHSFTYITLDNRTDYGYIAYFYPGDWSNCVFDNWVCDNCRYGISSYGANYKFTNSTFKNIYYYFMWRGLFAGDSYVTSSNASTPYTNEQAKITFDNCTFQDCYDSSGAERVGYPYSTVIKFKDCTFQGVDDAMSYGVYAYYASKMLYEGTTTFTNVTTNRIWSNNGTHLHTFALDLTVNDSAGSPLENAHVTVRQKEGNEVWHFETDSDGKITDCFGDNPVFVEKEEISTGNYDQWSDGNGDQIHEITISHPDYALDTREVAFTEDRTIVAQLSDNAVGVTKIYDSMLYDSTVY